MTDRIDLDHVALAFEHAWDGFDRYGGDLGGRLVGGGPDPGFSWHQVRFSNAMTVELLEPMNIEVDDFLRRFLDRNGPGPHHATFKVPDIHRALERCTASGYEPVRLRLDAPGWKEAFLHPKASHGIVIQLAEAEEHEHPLPEGLPRARTKNSASLDRIVHLVADLDAATQLFVGVLDGEVVGEASDAIGRGFDIAWPGPGRFRIIEPSPGAPAAWLGTRAGRVHHLAFTADRPVSGAEPLDADVWELAPENNHGTRLHIRTP